jgi:hypothetical protein
MSSAVKRIQYASGLSRALREGAAASDLLRPVAPYLALCGNIVHPRSAEAGHFLRWASRNYELIWWVPGHKEVYAAGKRPGGRFEYGLTDNLTAMYDLIREEGLTNIHIANKLSKNYRDFKVLGVSAPNFNEKNIEEIYYNTGKAFTLADLEYHRLKDLQWIEREIYTHSLQTQMNYTPLVVLTDGYFITRHPYSGSIIGDSKVNITGFNHAQFPRAWFGVNNWEAPGYEVDKFVELV